MDSLHADMALISVSYAGPAGNSDSKTGELYHWTPSTDTFSGNLAPTNATGAIWFCGGKAYMLNVSEDACPTPPSHSGKFVITSTDSDWDTPSAISVAKQDNGRGSETGGLSNTATWDVGWVDCQRARGATSNSVSISVSARGEYWITSSYVWRHTTTDGANVAHKYENAFSNEGGASFNTLRIDNANAIAVKFGNTSGHVYVGYDDLGVWKSTDTGDSWTKKTPNAHSSGYGGNVTSLIVLGAGSGGDSLYATMAVTSEADSNTGSAMIHRYYLWRSLDGGTSWTGYGDLPGGFQYGLSRAVAGRMWCTSQGRLYYSTNSGSSWSAASTTGGLPTVGLYTTAAYSGTVYAGGYEGLWMSTDNGSNWTEVGNFDYSGLPGDIGEDLNHIQWNGVHKIYLHLASGEAWVTVYAPWNYSGSNGKGLYRGAIGSTTLTQLVGANLIRGVAVDSCDMRVHVTSGEAQTNGANTGSNIAAGKGKATYHLSGLTPGTFSTANVTYEACPSTFYRYPFGADIAADLYGHIAISAPGYGVMMQTMDVGSTCETQIGGGGDEMGLGSVRLEGTAGRTVKQTLFRLEEVRERKDLYDLRGRQAKADRPGIYFQRIVSKSGAATRRTVVVVP